MGDNLFWFPIVPLPITEIQKMALTEILLESDLFVKALGLLSEYEMYDIWLTGGIIRNTVWNHIHGYEPAANIDDIDIIYHSEIITAIQTRNIDGFEVHFENQAYIHEWFMEHRDLKMSQFESCEDALKSFTDTCSAVMVRYRNGQFEIKSYAGLSDLLEGKIHPINVIPGWEEQYNKRLEKWDVKNKYPKIKIATHTLFKGSTSFTREELEKSNGELIDKFEKDVIHHGRQLQALEMKEEFKFKKVLSVETPKQYTRGAIMRTSNEQLIHRKSDKWFLENEWENQITDLLKDMLDLNELDKVVTNSKTDLEQHVIYFNETADVLDDESGMIWCFRYPGMTVGHIYIDNNLIIREIKLYEDMKTFIFQKDRVKELDQFIGWRTSVML